MSKIKQKYLTAKNAKVGETCVCPSCGTSFVKTSYQQVFCKTKGGTVCKDKYWNTVTPTKRNNVTRISPANRAYYLDVILPNEARERGYPDVETMLNDVDEGDEMSASVENCEWCGLKPEYCRCCDYEG